MNHDNINNNDLPRLTTQELINIYHNRKNDADAVWGLVTMRAILYEQVLKENNSLLLLLRECARLIESPYAFETSEDAEEIRNRIKELLLEHEEQS